MPDDGFLPYGRQWIDDRDIQQVVEVLQSDFLTTGPAVARFERALAARCDCAHAVAVSSGSAALHAVYHAAGLCPGDEIITSPLTFAATANAALYLGATVRFVDVEQTAGTLDPDQIEAAISPRTRLIVPVDYAGQPADYDRINEIADHYGIDVIADASHSLGGRIGDRPVGALATASVTSFHPVKLITTGEGGAVLTDSADIARRAESFRSHGIELVEADRERVGPWYTGMQVLGFNYRLSDVHSALGEAQLARLDDFVVRRAAIAGRYHEAFADLAAIERPEVRAGVTSAWHLYVIQVRAKHRRRLFERLRQRGLGVQVHYLPVYWHPFYRDQGYGDISCPVAEERYQRSISLPIYPRMSDHDVDRVITVVRSALEELG
jgi:UDP-4-amino-4,6-dideoxy-N-acetyl-beta-L-altrosamine transaminase